MNFDARVCFALAQLSVDAAADDLKPVVGESLLFAGIPSVFDASKSTRRWIPHLTASATASNVFDVAYADPASDVYVQNVILQDGCGYHLKVQYEF